MNCSDFQSNLDLYLDGELGPAKMPAATSHVSGCRSCHHTVTDHQQARALLITAVADRAAAVDVSGVWNEIAKRLDEPQPNVSVLAAFRARRALAPRSSIRRAAVVQAAAFTSAAAAAALVFSVFTGTNQTTPQQIAKEESPAAVHEPYVVPTGTRGAIAQSRPVRIDSMDIGAGHTVSTWIKPRTKTRVIWVASSNSGAYGVSNVSQPR